MDSKTMWKYIALGAAAVYVYKVATDNGGTLKGNRDGVRLNGDKIIDSALPWLGVSNPILRETIKQGAKKFMGGL